MRVDDARRILATADRFTDGPINLPLSVLAKLTTNDVPDGGAFQVGTLRRGAIHLDWNGAFRHESGSFYAEADHTWTRKYWYAPIGLEQYLDLVRRAVETRHKLTGDVEVTHYDDDGAYVSLLFKIALKKKNLRDAYDEAKRIEADVLELVDDAADKVGQLVAKFASGLSAWRSESLDDLVEAVQNASSTDDKGRSLEELCSKLLASVPGFAVTGRIRTETEEIDIFVVNGNDDPRLRRESAIILAECKNWTGKCGKNEFVLFRQKSRIDISGPALAC